MFFESLSDLLAMGGHGPYVWSCYGLFVVLIIANVWHAKSEKNRMLKQAKAFARRNS
jgi:heme exporter protein D